MKRCLTLAVLLLASALPALAFGPKDGAEKNVAVLLFPGVQIIDYTGPWEVLGHARVDGHKAFRIYSVGETTSPIETAMGMTVIPSFDLARAPRPDVLVIPGGNVDPQLSHEALIRWIQQTAKGAEVVLSVCNGAFFLAQAGLLDGLEATTFAGMIDDLKTAAPKTKVVRDKRFVDNGKIITSAGLSSGIDGALHVIEKLYGKGTAQIAAVGMEYDWRPDSGWARASLADQHLDAGFQVASEYPRTLLRYEGTPGALGGELEAPHRRRPGGVPRPARQGLRRLARLEETIGRDVALRVGRRGVDADGAGRAGRGREGPDGDPHGRAGSIVSSSDSRRSSR